MMKNKILKVFTTMTALCAGFMLSCFNVRATDTSSSGSTGPVAGSVYDNPTSGLKEYCPEASEFSIRYDDTNAIVTEFTIACTDEYDAVMLPGVFIKDGTTYTAVYGGITFRRVSAKGKGVVVQNKAVVSSLEDNLQINYIRFDKGSTITDYAHAFNGWSNLTTVEGFTDAISPGTSGTIDLGNTFKGCSNLRSISLDFKGETVSLYNTFSDCPKLQTVLIQNASITRIENMAVRGTTAYSASTGVNVVPMNITFENIVFPDNSQGAYLNGAFNTVSGKITFRNCRAGDSELINFDRAFYQSKAIQVKPELTAQYNINCPTSGSNYNGANIEITGAPAYSANYMFMESTYGVIKLNGFVTADTKSMVSMFDSADFVSIQGLSSWVVGKAKMSQMFKDATTFYDTESSANQTDYLNTEILHDLQTVDLSQATHADEMMCFDNNGYIVDYRNLDLSGVDELTPVSTRIPFYTPDVAPTQYRLTWQSVYYQTEADTESCGGYKLTRVLGTGSIIAGNDLGHNIIVTGSAAGIRIINSRSGDTGVYNVIPGHELREYVRDDISYYSDSACTKSAILTTVLADGSNTTLYTNDDMIEEDVDAGVSFGFDTTTGNINATFEGSSGTVRLIDYNPTLTIRKEQDPQSYTIAGDAKTKSASQFYNIHFTVMHNGTEKLVKSITRNLNVTVKLPDDYNGGDVVVLHYSNGTDKSPEVLNSSLDRDNNTVSFHMSTFSYVGIFYNDTDIEQKEITVKWEDDGNYRNRSGIIFNWKANYDGGLTDTGTLEYTVSHENETKLPFNVSKVISGKTLTGIEVTHTLKSQIQHDVVWDANTLTLTCTVNDLTEKENRVVKVDMTDVTETDFAAFIAANRSLTVTVRAEYEDGTFEEKDVTKTLASNYKVYELPYEITTVLPNGTALANVKYTLNYPEEYELEIDYDTNVIKIAKEAEVYGDYFHYYLRATPDDSKNKDGKRPDIFKVKVIVKFGDNEYSRSVGIPCDDLNYSSYNLSVEIPGTRNGTPFDSITIEPDPVEGYSVTITKQTDELCTIDYVYENNKPDDTNYTKKVSLTFVGDTPDKRPQSLTIEMRDTKGGNQITRAFSVNTAATTTTQDISVPTSDDYVVISAVGFIDYRIDINGLNITATYTGSSEPIKKYTQNFMLEIKDNNNKDGSRPEKATLTVSDGKGNENTFELDVSKGDKFTHSINTADETSWSITKIEGFPERYKVSTSANNGLAEYTPEKIKKTVSVKFEGDADNQDQTRPTSILIEVKNGDSTVGTSTVDAGTNWSANVEVNKYVKGVEAKYTIDCADVKNYSKSVSEDTITLKFTGTLTQAAQNAVTTALNADGTAVDKDEGPDYSIENFDWIDYANRYKDLKRAYGYNKQKLYAHYIRYGIAEGRIATFTGKYSTVNEDILAAYFPDDYKYALISTDANGDLTINTDTTTESTTESVSENTVSGNSIQTAEPVEDSDGSEDSNVVENADGTTTEKMTHEDGTVTEITKDADGNIISTKQYKTGDLRGVPANLMIMFGVLSLLAGAYIGYVTICNKRPR